MAETGTMPEFEGTPQVAEQQQQARQKEPRHKYKGLLYNFGITEVVFGSISILLAIVTLIIAAKYKTLTSSYTISGMRSYHTFRYRHYFTYTSQGIWCGAVLIATGILGIKTRSNPSVSMFNANMALAIITACFMVPLMTLSGFAAGTSGHGQHEIKSLVAIHVILAILGLPAAIVCIIHSAYCCAGVCCQHKAYQGPVTYVAQPFGTNQPQQVVSLANGQYMLVPFQPMASYGYNQSSAGPAMYPPPQAGMTMQQQAAAVQPTVIYPGGAQQTLQPGSAMTSLPSTRINQAVPQSQPWDNTKSQDPPGYSA